MGEPLVAGVVLLAVVAVRSRDLSTATLALMPAAIAINIAVGAIVVALRLPIYLDSIGTVLVGVVLSFVTMLSVLSVPLMINPNSPTMITVDVAYRINTHSDYAVANALCLLSLLVAAGGAWFYLRHAARGAQGAP